MSCNRDWTNGALISTTSGIQINTSILHVKHISSAANVIPYLSASNLINEIAGEESNSWLNAT